MVTREPGGTELGSALRRLLLHAEDAPPVGARAETLMMAADRAQHVEEVVEPALATGRSVISDRSVYSSLAYQGGARGLGVDEVRAVNDFALAGRWPDLVILLEVDPTQAFARRSRALDRLEAEGDEFHGAVARTYEGLLAQEPERFVVVSASGSIESVAKAVWSVVEGRL